MWKYLLDSSSDFEIIWRVLGNISWYNFLAFEALLHDPFANIHNPVKEIHNEVLKNPWTLIKVL